SRASSWFVSLCYLAPGSAGLCDLHSFPTRRSSDLFLAQLQRRLEGLESRLDRLKLRAPFSGRVDLKAPLHEGQWLGENDALISVHSAESIVIDGLVSEQDLEAIETGQTGVFIADSGMHRALPLWISNINVSAVPFLRYQELASDNGGPIAVRQVGAQLVPESARYGGGAELEEDARDWSSTLIHTR